MNPFLKVKGIKVFRNKVLANYTSFHIGGKANYLILVYSKEALRKVLAIIKKRRLRYFVLGAGTNLLFSDQRFKGVIIKLCGRFKRIYKNGEYFYCGAGAMLEELLNKTKKIGYGDAEFLAGIPGTIGGAIKGNAGAFGDSIGSIVENVVIINKNLVEKELNKKQIGFSYRGSRINDHMVIIGAKIKLVKKDKKNIESTIKRNLQYRCLQQPRGFSAGSFFKNPSGISAGRLIEECGLKGLRIGDALVSERHGNFIINCGHAKASDIIKLMKIIKKVVKKRRGITLKEEVKILRR